MMIQRGIPFCLGILEAILPGKGDAEILTYSMYSYWATQGSRYTN